MSVITDVVLCADDGDGPAVDAVSERLLARKAHRGGSFATVLPPGSFGGGKVAGITVWGASFNFLDHDELLAAVRAAPWQFPSDVAVITWYENADGPFTWTLEAELSAS